MRVLGHPKQHKTLLGLASFVGRRGRLGGAFACLQKIVKGRGAKAGRAGELEKRRANEKGGGALWVFFAKSKTLRHSGFPGDPSTQY